MEIEQANVMNCLKQIAGTWNGEGTVEYPTIATVRYRETLVFSMNEGKAYLHYNQRTWRKDEHENEVPSHWETGFWRVLGGGEMELLCAQASGRVEVAHGTLTSTEEGFILTLQSDQFANDTRVEQTWREFIQQGDHLRYALKMQTSAVPALTMHVQAQLNRQS